MMISGKQHIHHYPYGELWRPPSGSSANAFLFEGKERLTADGIREWDYDARRYCSMHVPFFTTPDPLAEKTPWLSPYVFCAANPVMNTDPTGLSTLVTRNADDTFTVVGGNLDDDDLNIYLATKNKDGKYESTGVSIGVTTSITSFYDSDANEKEGMWSTGSIINPNDNSGEMFFADLVNHNPTLTEYMMKARNRHQYDFKVTNGVEGSNDELDAYRGISFGKNNNGQHIYTSARDIGNIGAGYIAAVNGLSWGMSIMGFDIYQSYTDGKRSEEGRSTREAERYGWLLGNSVSNLVQVINLNCSLIPCRIILDVILNY